MSYKDTYVAKMTPYAKKASSSLNIPYQVILTQWAHETGYGTSALVKRGSNNHAGIKSSSRGKDFVSGQYSGYNSLDSFVRDYVRVMNLSYYDKVRSTGSTGDINKTIDALHESPWAEDTKYDQKMKRVFNSLNFDVGTIEIPDTVLNLDTGQLENMSNEELKKMALIGLGVMAVVGLIK